MKKNCILAFLFLVIGLVSSYSQDVINSNERFFPRVHASAIDNYVPDFSEVNEDGVRLYYKLDYDIYGVTYDNGEPSTRIFTQYCGYEDFCQIGSKLSDGMHNYIITDKIPNGNLIVMPNYENLKKGIKSKRVGNDRYSYSDSNYEGCKVVRIPSHVIHNGVEYTVTKIADDAFSCSKDIEEIYVPNTVIYVNQSAFKFTNTLKRIVFEEGSSVILMMPHSISSLPNLEEIVLPSIDKNGLMVASSSIGRNCPKLKRVYADLTWEKNIEDWKRYEKDLAKAVILLND